MKLITEVYLDGRQENTIIMTNIYIIIFKPVQILTELVKKRDKINDLR